jgi:hypothetical protein
MQATIQNTIQSVHELVDAAQFVATWTTQGVTTVGLTVACVLTVVKFRSIVELIRLSR